MNPNPANKMAAGFWIRLVSDCIDAALLGLFGLGLSLLFGNLFYRLGESGVWIGVLITFVYTGLLQSAIGGGQSVAKRILKIQVLKMDGGYLTLPASFLRYSVIALLFYGASINQALAATFSLLSRPVFQLVVSAFFVALFVGTFIMVPLHPLKRGIHDLISGSIVVYKDTFDADRVATLEDSPKVKRTYIISLACAALVAFGVFTFGVFIGSRMANLDRLSRVQKPVEQASGLTNVSIQKTSLTFHRDGTTIRTLAVGGFLRKASFDDLDQRAGVARKARDAALAAYGSPVDIDRINIVVRTGYSIGLYSWSQAQTYTFGAAAP